MFVAANANTKFGVPLKIVIDFFRCAIKIESIKLYFFGDKLFICQILTDKQGPICGFHIQVHNGAWRMLELDTKSVSQPTKNDFQSSPVFELSTPNSFLCQPEFEHCLCDLILWYKKRLAACLYQPRSKITPEELNKVARNRAYNFRWIHHYAFDLLPWKIILV